MTQTNATPICSNPTIYRTELPDGTVEIFMDDSNWTPAATLVNNMQASFRITLAKSDVSFDTASSSVSEQRSTSKQH